jgi:hypothetical protein
MTRLLSIVAGLVLRRCGEDVPATLRIEVGQA